MIVFGIRFGAQTSRHQVLVSKFSIAVAENYDEEGLDK
jgi:hypothetical protein